MSLVFSNPTNKSGIVERLDRKVGTDQNPLAYPIAEKVSDINAAVDAALIIVADAGGRWGYDSANQIDLPIITTGLVAGQRDYAFTVDGAGNQITDIYKLLVADQNGFFRQLTRRDPRTERDTQQFWNGQNVQGIPFEYELLGQSILLNPIPSYSLANALKMYCVREDPYFTALDTTKMPGLAGILHEWFVIHAAYAYASRNNLEVAGGVLKNGQRTGYLGEVYAMENTITAFYGNRGHDDRAILIPRITPFK